MARSFLAFSLLALLASGCTVLVDGMLQNKGGHDAGADSGPPGATCGETADCLTDTNKYDCTQVCVGSAPGHCMHVAGTNTPDGTLCGARDGTEICVAGSCVDRSCGDGYVDRSAMPPEYCDDGDANRTGGTCEEDCSRPCGGRYPNCDDDDPCNGMEMCDTLATPAHCLAQRVDPATVEGMVCTTRTISDGTCRSGVCVSN